MAFVQLAESTMFGGKGCKVPTTAEAASTKTKGNEPPDAAIKAYLAKISNLLYCVKSK